jgi:hypothetical protein
MMQMKTQIGPEAETKRTHAAVLIHVAFCCNTKAFTCMRWNGRWTKGEISVRSDFACATEGLGSIHWRGASQRGCDLKPRVQGGN